MNHSTPGLPVHHQLLEFTQTHVHRVSDATQASHPLSTPSHLAPNSSQHQSLFQWVNSSHEVAKVLKCKSKPQWDITSHHSEWPSSRNLQTINSGKGVEKRECSCTIGGNVNGYSHYGRQYGAAAAKSLQSCPTLCDPIDGSPPGFPVPGILQARTLEWVAISFSKRESNFYLKCIAWSFFKKSNMR